MATISMVVFKFLQAGVCKNFVEKEIQINGTPKYAYTRSEISLGVLDIPMKEYPRLVEIAINHYGIKDITITP